ncbi:hypothetical protein G7046_g7949 [Stylonectria norvegica]|nr:hypothetical protein G7046_g7949 [Stylonectria norvegica]
MSPRHSRITKPSLQPPFFRAWILEISALVIATGLIGAIIALLVTYNGHKLPDWPHSINLNTTVALLSTLYRTLIAIVLAEIISQQKWTWFKNGARPLSQLQTFDDASRGVLGSMSLIVLLRCGFRGNPLATAAALVTIISLAIGPFTQQAIRTVACQQVVPGPRASIPIAHSLPGSDTFFQYQAGDFELGAGLKGAMINGLANPFGDDSAIKPTCSTGNCTFPLRNRISHSTIGLCSECIDTTQFASVSIDKDGIRNVTVGNVWINGGSNFKSILSVGPDKLEYAESIMDADFKDRAQNAITNVTVLTFSKEPCKKEGHCPYNVTTQKTPSEQYYVASSCALYPCMKDISAKVHFGQLEEKVTATTLARLNSQDFNLPAYGPRLVVKSPCIVNDRIYDVGNFSLVPNVTDERTFKDVEIDNKTVAVPTDCYYQMHGPYLTAVRNFLEKSLLSGSCLSGPSNEMQLLCDNLWWLSRLFSDNKASYKTLESAFNDFVTASTNFFRTDGWGPANVPFWYSKGGIKSIVMGEAQETTVCMQLNAPWLILPSLLCLVAIVLLGTTLVYNHMDRRQPVWKSSILPLLFYGLERQGVTRDGLHSDPVSDPAEVQDLKALNDAFGKLVVRFQLGDEGNGASFVRLKEEQPDEHEMESEVNLLLVNEEHRVV